MISYMTNVSIIGRFDDVAVIATRSRGSDSAVGYEVVDRGSLVEDRLTNEVAEVFIWNAYTKEGVPTKYAFGSLKARILAEGICKTPGVGPSTASAIVHRHGPDYFVQAVIDGDSRAVAAGVRGVSEKKARAIIDALSSIISEYAPEAGACIGLPIRQKVTAVLDKIYGAINEDVLTMAIERSESKEVGDIITIYQGLLR